MRILVVNDLFPPDSDGGLELSSFEIGNALAERGHEVEFVTSKWRTTFLGERVEQPRVFRILNYYSTGAGGTGRFASLRAVVTSIRNGESNAEVLKAHLATHAPYDLAILFGLLGVGLLTARALTKAQIPIIWNIGDVSIPTHFDLPNHTRLYKLGLRTLVRRSFREERELDFSKMVFVSDFVCKRMFAAGIQPGCWKVIPRGIESAPLNLPVVKRSPPIILVACRLTPSRGVHVAIAAVEKLLQKCPQLEWQMLIAGDGDKDYLAHLRRLAGPLGARLKFMGKLPREGVMQLMREATVFINPTVEVEGFGRINIEAMACGAALLTSDVPSVHEIVEHGEQALLFPASDPDSLMHSICAVLEDPTLFARLTSRALIRVEERFLQPRVIDQVDKFLLQSLQNKQVI